MELSRGTGSSLGISLGARTALMDPMGSGSLDGTTMGMNEGLKGDWITDIIRAGAIDGMVMGVTDGMTDWRRKEGLIMGMGAPGRIVRGLELVAEIGWQGIPYGWAQSSFLQETIHSPKEVSFVN
jgi:hypothetical protein